MMIEQNSFARITLALDIIKKLVQGPFAGYHELQIIKHQIDLRDVIAIEPSQKMQIISNDPHVPLDEKNLCWRAVDLIKQYLNSHENVSITIHKQIPVQGGLAGGSANAATVLSMINTLWEGGLSNEQLIELSRALGMDVPYYFLGGTVFDTEATGVLKKIDTALNYDFVIAVPDFGVSTPKAYQEIDYNAIALNSSQTKLMEEAFVKNVKEKVIEYLHNDFENSVFKRYPVLAHIQETLLKLGCRSAVMSGSGSAVLGIAFDKEHAQWIKNSMHCFCIVASSR